MDYYINSSPSTQEFFPWHSWQAAAMSPHIGSSGQHLSVASQTRFLSFPGHGRRTKIGVLTGQQVSVPFTGMQLVQTPSAGQDSAPAASHSPGRVESTGLQFGISD